MLNGNSFNCLVAASDRLGSALTALSFYTRKIRSILQSSLLVAGIAAGLLAMSNVVTAEQQNTDVAARPLVDFSEPSYTQRYRELIGELRCPKCQNQNLADSDAPIAKDLRSELVRLLEEGKDDQAILDFMTLRYGDFVRYRPALSIYTAALWVLPMFIFLLGLVIVRQMLKHRNTSLEAQTKTDNKVAMERSDEHLQEGDSLGKQVEQLVERANAER